MTDTKDTGLERINSIIDHEIRPFLQRDGGDLAVVDLKENVLTINYQGACGCCPHAKMGTLMMIEGVLKERYDPSIMVKIVD